MLRNARVESLEDRRHFSVSGSPSAGMLLPAVMPAATHAPLAAKGGVVARPGEAAGFDPQPDPPAGAFSNVLIRG